MSLKEIKKDEISKDLKGILLNLDNGDLISVDAIKTKWKFKNREDVLRYALAVIAQSENPVVYISKGGEKIPLAPNKSLLEEEQPETKV
jgi:hypothetical protein